MKSTIIEMDRLQLETYVRDLGAERFRADQLRNAIYERFAISFDEMSTLPARLRERLETGAVICDVETAAERVSRDGTVKYLLELSDRNTVEMVWIPQPGRNTLCISSQVGCPVMCRFCASGEGGLQRNLTPAEIACQVLLAARIHGEKPDNIVVMGVGEPLLNFDNLAAALAVLNDKDRFGIGARRITVSTSGIVPAMRRLADLGRQYNLAVSIHAPDDRLRAVFIPDHHRYGLDEIVDACVYYYRRTNRKPTFEYVLVAGRNDEIENARQLGLLAERAGTKVNLIPCNPGGDDGPPSRTRVHAFLRELEARGIGATVRAGRGADITAACGQLRSAARRDPGPAVQ